MLKRIAAALLLVMLVSIPTASAGTQICPDPTVNARGFVDCVAAEVAKVERTPLTTSAATSYGTGPSTGSDCGVSDVTASVDHHGVVFNYDWSIGFGFSVSGHSVPGVSQSSPPGGDSSNVAAPIVKSGTFFLAIGDSFAAWAGITNKDVVADGASSMTGATCYDPGSGVGVLLPLDPSAAKALVDQLLCAPSGPCGS